MATKYQTKITKARFIYSPLSGQRMAEIGQSLIEAIFERWDRGIGVDGSPAPPLAQHRRQREDGTFTNFRGYQVAKVRKTGSSIRDLKLSGRLRRSIKALSANENKVTLGPVDGMHTRLKRGGILTFSDVLTINQRRFRMWGVSPAEKAKLVRLFAGERPVKATVTKAA